MIHRIASAALPAVLAAAPALAHHPLGGAAPTGFAEGFLSGVGHPVIGIDHLAFVLLTGLAAAFMRRGAISPLAFVLGTVGGCLLVVGGVALPAVEPVIAGSVLALGVPLLCGRRLSLGAALPLFALAGLFHGWAYGEAVIGAEPAAIGAYLLGFGTTQYAIAAGVLLAVRRLWRAGSPSAVQPRLAAAVCAGVGLVFAAELVELALLG